ncbi:MAG: diphthine--ammonia ligase [Candidatus Woesearchaeota archaeon]
MCGIVGIFGEDQADQKVKLALETMKNRGKDKVGIASSETIQYGKQTSRFLKFKQRNLFGHRLHSLVGSVPQPLRGKGLLIANCEIYNWKELAEKYKLKVKNDAGLLLSLLDQQGASFDTLNKLDGVYAFAYWIENRVFLSRDLLGVKPIWYYYTQDVFAFASEKKALEVMGYVDIQELNPRQMIIYDLKSKKIEIKTKEFLSYTPEHSESKEIITVKVEQLLSQAIDKRIPDKKFGILFSGGVDSTFIVNYLKKKKVKFCCYTAVLDTEKVSSDLEYAKKAAKELKLKLKVKKIKISQLERYLKKIVPLIEDSNVTKVEVALTLYLACELAQKDGCKVVFSGLGSEEIFAGYERHKLSTNINQECVSGLLKLYERDLYRDDVLTMDNNLELRLPFLDLNLVDYCLKIPQQYKISEKGSKIILREIAEKQRIPIDLAWRKKVAAQYGSLFDWGLEKLSRQKGFISRSSYLKELYPRHNLRLGVLFSSGKDSTYAAMVMQRQNYELTCLITLMSENQDSYMFHTPAIELAKLQAEAMEIPLVMCSTKGEKESELVDLKKALSLAKKKHKIDGIVTGALFSTYQRDRIEKVCDQVGLKIFSPLWHKPQEVEMRELLANGFEIMFTAVAAEGLDRSWLNRSITTEDVDLLVKLKEKLGTNVAGEGGEFESLVLNCPLFKKRLVIEEAKIVEDNSCTARLLVKKAKLEDKKI